MGEHLDVLDFDVRDGFDAFTRWVRGLPARTVSFGVWPANANLIYAIVVEDTPGQADKVPSPVAGAFSASYGFGTQPTDPSGSYQPPSTSRPLVDGPYPPYPDWPDTLRHVQSFHDGYSIERWLLPTGDVYATRTTDRDWKVEVYRGPGPIPVNGDGT